MDKDLTQKEIKTSLTQLKVSILLLTLWLASLFVYNTTVQDSAIYNKARDCSCILVFETNKLKTNDVENKTSDSSDN